uniref:Uncharacterized protein n=1 Tax=Trichuris muris TaxID=70415 RepID=A0A5S6QRQ7_TRIMR
MGRFDEIIKLKMKLSLDDARLFRRSRSLTPTSGIGEYGLRSLPIVPSNSVSFPGEDKFRENFSTSSAWRYSLSNLFRHCCRSLSHFFLLSNRDTGRLTSNGLVLLASVLQPLTTNWLLYTLCTEEYSCTSSGSPQCG